MADEQASEKINKISLEKIVDEQVWENFLKTKQQQEKALVDLQALQAHPGWILLEKIMNLNIKVVEKAILDDFLTPEQEKEKKQDRVYLKLFKEFPLFLISMIRSSYEQEAKINSDDPYES